ncbi:MAG: UvrD-helicase domain-containing protein [Vicinamibacterales bacterium]
MSSQPRLDFDSPSQLPETADARARRLAVDPSRNVALEASAGTGKTRVLVDRYVGLLEVGVSPRHILAITFTRKAAAEMRQRVMATLRERYQLGAISAERWRDIREAFSDISIMTIDAFCLALLHEFPLEAGVDPGFDLADETETPRLVAGSLDSALRIGRALSLDDPDVALVFAELGEFQLRKGLALLLDRRLVAWDALNGFLRGREMHVATACERLLQALRGGLTSIPGGARRFIATGPKAPLLALVARDLELLMRDPGPSPALLRGALDRLAGYVLTQAGEPRKKPAHKKAEFGSAADYAAHKDLIIGLAPHVEAAIAGFRRDINLVLARGVRRLFKIAQDEYRRTLDKQGVLDFPDLLEHTLKLLGQMEEFSRSRYRLESRYEHVLVDEFQDTSRAQWNLVRQLVRAWSEGEGLSHGPIPPSIFIVGDRKQSIYGFRDAEVTVLDAAARYIDALRPDTQSRAAITRSYRSVHELLAFVNDVCSSIATESLSSASSAARPDAFRYGEDDVFPRIDGSPSEPEAIGVVMADSDTAQAEAAAEEIARLLTDGAVVRDRATGVRRAITPGDIGILFRTRDSHALFEAALGSRGVPYYVYKGLGFFDADEVKDVLALIAYCADPASNLRAAAFLRSGFVGISDEGLKLLAPRIADALLDGFPLPTRIASRQESPPDKTWLPEGFPADDLERLTLARASIGGWLALADQLPPAELVDRVLAESAYAAEIAGPGLAQARENLKKVRGLIRRIQNRGYATLGRLVDYFAELVAGGDESNAIIDAADAVNLMTVHAAKGLEFPVVFVVGLGKGSGGGRDPIRVVPAPFAGEEAEDEIVASVAVGDHLNEADRDNEGKEHEETKRLLYVALTRARDRLYLGATRSAGKFAPARGSLGRILPDTLKAVLSSPDLAAPLQWAGESTMHGLRPVPPAGESRRMWRPAVTTREHADDFEPLAPTGVVRIAATQLASLGAVGAPRAAAAAASTARLGSLVHRALQRAALDPTSLARDPLPPDVVRICEGLLSQPGLQAILAAGAPIFEVPFSVRHSDGHIVRGSIDCLVMGDRVTVVEFKTGGPQPQHQRQLELYVEAIGAVLPGRNVEGRLVYAGPAA